jgi:pimeloyl-ACP methyl ester carboxylesterase
MKRPTMRKTQLDGCVFETIDKGSGEPVLLIHGSMADECAAVLEQPSLAGAYRLIHYYRRGWDSDGCPDAPVSIEQQSRDAQALLAHLGVSQAHLVGQSYGAVISLQVALDAPDLVHSLSLLEPPLFAALSESAAAVFGALAEKAGSHYQAGEKQEAVDVFGRAVAGDNYRAELEKVLPEGSVERWVAKADTLFRSELPALTQWSFTRTEAGRITPPVLNMSGASTASYFKEIHEALSTWIPHSEADVVPGSTHAMINTHPKEAAERIAAFLARHPISQSR